VIRLVLPLAGIVVFFLLSLVTVRLVKPRQPRLFFLGYAVALLPATAWTYVSFWPIAGAEDAAGLMACLLLQTLFCLTFWNGFYSLLWGFSGGLMFDLYNDPALRHTDRLVRSYEGDVAGTDRIMARRLPNLASGGYITIAGDTLRLRLKGRLIAIGTLAAFKVFSLGMGGGVK
jgi:hypothetical protein